MDGLISTNASLSKAELVSARCSLSLVIFIFIVEGLTLVSELKDGEILSLDLSDRKWGTANIAGNIALEIPQVIYF